MWARKRADCRPGLFRLQAVTRSEVNISANGTGQGHAIHVGHALIEEHQGIGPSVALCCLELCQSARAICHTVHLHVPSSQRRFQDGAVGGIVIHA